MKFMVISLLLVLIPLSSALNLYFSSPDEVGINETFSVSIVLETSKTFDVKIFVHDNLNKTLTKSDIISDILNSDKWQSSWFYISSSFPDKKDYQLKIKSRKENTEICVQLRETGKTSFTKLCKSISVAEDIPKLTAKESKPLIVNDTIKNEQKQTIRPQEEDIIILNRPKTEIVTKSGKILDYLIYISLSISVIILILLLLKPRL